MKNEPSSLIKPEEIKLEKDRLKKTIGVIREQLSSLGQELYDKEDRINEFKKFVWDNRSEMDPTELKQVMAMNENEVFLVLKSGEYFKKLYKIQNNPYFGSIILADENHKKELIYIGLTHLVEGDFQHLIYDWRSPVCSVFYDYELGPCAYDAPQGIIKGELIRKRQYKIVDGKLRHVFDNNLNVDDELLQEVLAKESSDKMKNIVNTIQQEQNKIIRNTSDKNLIVQGIAGSGKTSVALHRIAFLLYKLKNLSSKNVLIFSPNRIFTEYISNVLPELGEENTMQTTFHDFLKSSIDEYKNVESFVEFIARYYQKNVGNEKLIIYKQSDEIIYDLTKYIKSLIMNAKFTSDICVDKHEYLASELFEMFSKRYAKLPIFKRVEEMAIKLSENNYNGKHNKVNSFKKAICESLNIKLDFKEIYANFFKSEYTKIKISDETINNFIDRDLLYYEDALLFVFIKGLLNGFDYNGNIKQVIIDEAQDYSKLQYIIISKIFKNAGLTILGDINQTINPYYEYKSLNELTELLSGTSVYLELSKTYRSTQEIIEYSNKILGLDYVSAIRKSNENPVLLRENKDIKEQLLNDLTHLSSEHHSIAIITKTNEEAESIYDLLQSHVKITLVNDSTSNFKKDLIVLPSYMAKGLEFDAVIVVQNKNNYYSAKEKKLYYVACTRAQHELIIYS